jgi:hypothetical protein
MGAFRAEHFLLLQLAGSAASGGPLRRRLEMKKKVLLVIGLGLLSLTLLAAAKDQTWNGWISDSKCGANGANASHEACAKKCIGAGEKPVFVSDKDQKVIPIDNPGALQEHIGHHVAVTGTMTASGSMHVDSVKMLAQTGGSGGGMSDMH